LAEFRHTQGDQPPKNRKKEDGDKEHKAKRQTSLKNTQVILSTIKG
jgi:hypothetical protein